MPSQSLALAYEYCRRLTCAHYENFPVGSLLLPGRVRPAVYAIYAFSRIADDFSDEPEFAGKRLECLNAWEAALARIETETPTHPVFIALKDTVRRYGLPVGLLSDLLHAFKMDLDKTRYETDAELLDYCRYSANPVGRLVLILFGHRAPELFAYSDAICTALQLANHWQDLSVDIGRGRLYVPRERMARHGLTSDDVMSGRDTPVARALTRELVAWTEDLFLQGFPLIGALSGRLKREIHVTWLGGMRVLEKIKEMGYFSLETRPVLSKRDWIAIVMKVFFYGTRYSHTPTHEFSSDHFTGERV